MDEAEEWRDIPGYEELYQVSNMGRVKSVTRKGTGRKYGLRVPQPLDSGYWQVDLFIDGKRKHWTVHSLVMLAFVGPCPKGYEINHKDGVKSNSVLSNLEYCTKSYNRRHALDVLHAKVRHSEEHSSAKLTNEQVREIRRLYATGQYRLIDLANKYGISNGKSRISQIVRRLAWKHVED